VILTVAKFTHAAIPTERKISMSEWTKDKIMSLKVRPRQRRNLLILRVRSGHEERVSERVRAQPPPLSRA
jgi:hypothetical protein